MHDQVSWQVDLVVKPLGEFVPRLTETLSSVIEKPTFPSVVSRPERFAACAMPRSRRSVRAASR